MENSHGNWRNCASNSTYQEVRENRMRLPGCFTFTKKVQKAIGSSGDVFGERRYELRLVQNEQRVNYSTLGDLTCIRHRHKYFLICELYDLLTQLRNCSEVTSKHVQPARDTCQFRAMGNLLVHFGYATYHVSGRENVYRKRIGETMPQKSFQARVWLTGSGIPDDDDLGEKRITIVDITDSNGRPTGQLQAIFDHKQQTGSVAKIIDHTGKAVSGPVAAIPDWEEEETPTVWVNRSASP